MNRSEIEKVLGHVAPRMPRFEREAVVDHALGTPAFRHTALEEAAWLSMLAFVRHQMTEYDTLLDDGYDVETARYLVADDMNAVLADWGVKRRL